ncbi:MAG: PAS domain-containing protein [Synechococcus sp.]|nr:PAS domain-containing protein [Synechococcus sp.]
MKRRRNRSPKEISLVFSWAIAIILLLGLNISWELKSLNFTVRKEAHEASHLVADSLIKSRDLYASEVVSKLKTNNLAEFSHDYSQPGIAPIPASYLIRLSEKIKEENPEMIVNYYSDYPFPWRKNGGPQDDFQKLALQEIRSNPSREFYRIEKFNGEDFFRYGIGDLMKPSCIECHNSHPDSPKTDWKEGDVRGVLEVSYPLNVFFQDSQDNYQKHLARLITITGLILGSIFIAFRKIIKAESTRKANGLLQEANLALEKKIDEKTKDLRLQQRAIAATQNGIIIVDALASNYPCIAVNPAFENITGYSAKEVIGRNCRFLQGADHNQPGLQTIRKSLKKKQSCKVIVRNYKKNGDVFWNELSISPIFDTEGKLTHFIGIQNDVTERVRSEVIMKRQADAMNATIDGVAILENDRFVYLNSSHVKLFGYDNEQELIGLSWKALYSPEEIKHFERNIFPILQEKGYWQGEAIANRKNGSTFIEGLSLSLQNNVIICVCRDVTTLKKAQQEVESSLKQKDILLREIHHRVKNNLLVVSSLIDWQSEFFNEPNLLSAMEDSQRRIRSMALIHEKLYRSFNLAELDLADYLKTLAEQIYASNKRHLNKAKLNFELQSIFVNIETATPCGLIVNELILNALEHAFPENQSGTILIHLSSDDNDAIKLSVKDDGIGFSENFNWRQSDSLGLQLVDLLTEQLEGDLDIQQKHGTEVMITFKELQYANRL